MNKQHTTRPLFKFVQKGLIILLAGLLLTVPITDFGSALTENERSSLSTPFYDPDSAICENLASTLLSGSDNIAKIYNYLIGKLINGRPLQDFQIAGILGNMASESSIEVQRLQGTRPGTITLASNVPRGQKAKAYGLVQWDPAHKMIDPVIASGKNPNEMQPQLDFLLDQLNGKNPSAEGGAGTKLIATTDVAEATVVFEKYYERHKGPLQPQRIRESERILDILRAGGGGSPVTTTPSEEPLPTNSTPTDDCGTTNTEGFAGKVLAYAWPDARPAPYTEKKPEYSDAVSAAIASGRYVGGGRYPGVDCGGFITTLLVDSGFEPEYNYSGLQSKGAGNVAGGQYPWVTANWEKIGNVSSTSQLMPGDVAINADRSHTFIYVGDIPGFESKIASSSFSTTGESWRSPMAGKENATRSDIEWFRKR